jgi:protein TonB
VPPSPTAAPPEQAPQPAPPAVQVGELVEMGRGVVAPEAIYNPRPNYPPAAERQRISGVVLLDVLVDENGAVQDVKLVRGIKPDFGLDAAAAAAVRTWRYKPATKNGVRVKIRMSVAVTFKLQG